MFVVAPNDIHFGMLPVHLHTSLIKNDMSIELVSHVESIHSAMVYHDCNQQ